MKCLEGLHLQQRRSKFSTPLAPEEGLVCAFQLEEGEKENEEEFVCSYQAPEVKEEGNDVGDPAIVSTIQNTQVSQQGLHILFKPLGKYISHVTFHQLLHALQGLNVPVTWLLREASLCGTSESVWDISAVCLAESWRAAGIPGFFPPIQQ
ncbi:protein PAT1 homolog 2-like [Arvicanthis niloticus]|uniref:protein PAT1 homolog 2-like n=1 Tax=Arvicanthis niloticus TaxID=61156 RepID=UPI00402BC549